MTGLLKSTSVETFGREAGNCSIAIAPKRAAALAYEKERRLPPDNPRIQILVAPSRYRGKRPSRRSAAQGATSHLLAELVHRAPIDCPFSCPWEDPSNWSVHADNPRWHHCLPVIHYTPECPIHHLQRWRGHSGDTNWWYGNGGNMRSPCQHHDPLHEPTARSSYYLITRRRDRGHVHGVRVVLEFTFGQCHLHWQPIAS